MTPVGREINETRPAYGLFSADDFLVGKGEAAASLNHAILPQALWFFRAETVAVPAPERPVAGFDPAVPALRDLECWNAKTPADALGDYPGIIWVAGAEVIEPARLDDGGERLRTPGGGLPFSLTPKIPSNLSYWNEKSRAFFAHRDLRLRGATVGGGFVARSIWPLDFRLDPAAPVSAIELTPQALRDAVRGEPRGGAQSEFASRVVWQRTPESACSRAGRPVIGLMLNGAQGDDDEAHAGHFSVLTGRVGAHGEMHDWLVANYYTLASESEKGILPAMLPLENFLTDLNSGQSWYRPSSMLVAVLRDERAAVRLCSAQARLFNHYYRYPLAYHHAVANCTGISVSTLRTLGWRVPALGATGWLKAFAALPLIALKSGKLGKGKAMFDYLTEDRTRLLPALAFEQAGADLLRLVGGRAARPLSGFETWLAQDVEEILFVRIPQLPSSRAWGDYPVASVDEYQARLPKEPAQQKIIPVEKRTFPASFGTLVEPGRQALRSDCAVAGMLFVIALVCVAALAYSGVLQ